MVGITNGSDEFTTGQPIQPYLGSHVFMDVFTGPPAVHGDASVVGFTYTIRSDTRVVASGNGTISDKLEDLE